jgi:hypothetical protein
VTNISSGHLNLLPGRGYKAAQGDASGIPNMRYLTDGLFLLVCAASRRPDEGFLNEIGWVAAALLIVGSSLAIASIAWFLIGLFVY